MGMGERASTLIKHTEGRLEQLLPDRGANMSGSAERVEKRPEGKTNTSDYTQSTATLALSAPPSTRLLLHKRRPRACTISNLPKMIPNSMKYSPAK